MGSPRVSVSVVRLILSSLTFLSLSVLALLVPAAAHAQLTYSPTALSFLPIPVGGNSITQTFTVTNTSSSAVTMGAATITANFAIGTNTCTPNTIGAGGTCTITVSSAPTVTGQQTGALTLMVGGTPYTAPLSGTGTLVSPAITSFGTQAMPGTGTATVTFSFAAAATLSSVSVVTQGVTGLDFAAGTQTGSACKAQAYAKNATCTVVVSYKPSTPGLRTGAVLLYDNESTPVIIGTAYLNGVGGGAQAALYPGTQTTLFSGLAGDAFGLAVDVAGNVFVDTSNSGVVTKNTLAGTTYTASTVGAGLGNFSNFAIDGAGNLFLPSPGGTEEVYTPSTGTYAQGMAFSSPGSYATAIDLNHNLFLSAGNTITQETPSASGSYSATTIGSSLGFNNIIGLGVDSNRMLYIADAGSGFLWELPASGTAYGTNIAEITSFSSSGNVNSVAVDPSGIIYTVADGASTQLFRFTPPTGSYTGLPPVGSFSRPNGVALDKFGNVYLADDGGGQAVKEINVSSPQTFAFGSTVAGSTSGTLTTTLYNIGNTPMSLTSLAYSNANFSSNGGGTTCSASTVLQPTQSCTVAIQFNPSTVGALTGTLTITDNALGVAGSTQTVNLTGTGTENLVFTTPPTTYVQTGQPVGTVVVSVEKADGSVDTTQTPTIQLDIAGIPGHQYFSQAAVNGVATFDLSSLVLAGGTSTYGYNFFATSTANYNNANPVAELVYPYQFGITGPSTPQAASTTTTNSVTARILDRNAAATTQTSPVTLTVTGPNGYSQTYGPTAASASNGSVTFTTAALSVTGTYNYALSGTSASGVPITGASANQSITAAPAVSLTITPASTFAVVGYRDNITVTAYDQYNNVATTYGGTIALTSTDPGPATLPANFTLSAGTATKPVTFNTLTNSGWTVTATDTVNSMLTMTTVPIVVHADPVFTINSLAGDTSGSCTDQANAGSPAGTTTDSACTVYAAFAAVTALNNANTAGYVPIINFTPSLYGQTITLTTAQSVTGNFALVGPGAGPNAITLSGGNAVTFLAAGGTAVANLTGLTFTNFKGAVSTVLTANGTIALTNDTFSNNTYTGSNNGGAVGINGAITVSGSTFTGNTSTGAGGAFAATPSSLNISNSTFSSNTAQTFGGAIALYGSAAASISNTTFANNKATANNGGGVYTNTSAALTMATDTFTSNAAAGSGGAIYSSGTLNIANGTFTGNQAGVSGGAVYTAGALTMTTGSTTFSGNFVSGSGAATGGALYSGNSANISGANFLNNYAISNSTSAAGGAAYIVGSTNAVANSLFSGNYVSSPNGGAFGGGVWGGGKFTGVTLTGNQTQGAASIQDGGAMYVTAVSTLYNATITGNSAKIGGGVYRNSTTTAYNTVISGNTAATYRDVYLVTLSAALNYIDTTSSGTCTVNCTPMLSALGNYGGPTQTMVPLPGSPLLAVGNKTTTTFVPATETTDGRGFPRVTNNLLDFGAVQTNYALAFVAQPTSTTVGTTLPPPPTVQVYESGTPFAPGVATGILNLAAASGTLSTLTAPVSASGLATISTSISQPQANDSLTATIKSTGTGTPTVATATSGLFNITDPAASSINFVTPPTYNVANGGNAGVVTVGLYTSAGALDTTASPTVTLTVTATGYTTATYNATAANGVATFDLSTVPLTVNGTYTYTATASAYTPDSVMATETVTAAVIGSFTVTGVPLTASVNTAYPFTVTAKDTTGATMTSFTGPVTLTTNDATAAFSTTNYTFTAADAGVHTFTVTFNAGGTRTITATANGGANGSETGIVVGGYIWLVNANGTIDKLAESGTAVTGAVGMSGSTSTLGGLAFDATGNVWSVTSGNNSLNFTSKAGTSATVFTGGGLNLPASIAVDGSGMVWVANSGNNSVSIFNNAGTPQTGSSGSASNALHTPSAVAIDSTGSVWVTNRSTSTVTRIFGAAAPVVTPLASGVANGTTGVKP